MEDRIHSCSKLTIDIIETLSIMNNCNLVTIIHPYIKNHLSHDLAKKYFKTQNDKTTHPRFLYSALIAILNHSQNALMNKYLLREKHPTDLKKSKVDPISIYNIDENGYVHLRLSVGYEDDHDTIVNSILEIFNKTN
jgi:hypothetical protein